MPDRFPAPRAAAVPTPRRLRALWLLIALGLVFAAPAPALAQKFGKNKITYENFDWHVYKAPHFDIYYYPEEEAFLEQVVSYAESAYVTLSQGLQHEPTFRIPLIYYKTHAEFEQTNITMGFIQEWVGAFAEAAQKRMVLPIDLPPNELYALIAHELTHIFEYSLLFQDSLGREVRGDPPTWLMEGLASFMAQDEDSFDLMYIRDGVVNGLLPGLEQLNVLAFLTYRYGHAVFDFMKKEFGMEGVRTFLLEFRKVLLARNLEKAIKEAFGWEIQEFDRRFHKYLRAKYLPLLLEKDEPSDYGREIAFTSQSHQGRYFQTLSPTLSPSGDLFAALTTRYDDLDVVIFSARDGEPVRNLTKGYSTEYESISVGFSKGWKDLAWSPDGDRIAFFARRGNRQPLFVYHVVTGDKLAEIPVDIQKLASPSFSPDGKRVAFAGNQRGVVDIFSVDLETREVRNHTQDEFYDSNPSWSADGKQILYNRRLQAYEKVFMVDAADASRKTQMTFGATSDIQPAFSADGRYVYYVSDYGSEQIYNIYSLDLSDGVVRRYTDVVGGNFSPVELNLDASGRRRLAYTSFFRQRFQIYELPVDEPLQVFRPGQPPDPPQPRRAADSGSRKGGTGGGGGATPPRAPGGFPGAGGNPGLGPVLSAAGSDTARAAGAPMPRWRLSSLEPAPLLASAAVAAAQAIGQEPPPGAEPPPVPAEVEKFEPPLKLRIDESEKSRYTKKKWSIDGHPQVVFGVADDGTILSDSYIIFSDLLGDYRHFVQLRSVSTFTDIDYIFANLKHRQDWYVHAQDKRDYFIVGQTSSGLERQQALRTTGAEIAVRYPVSLFHRFDVAVGYFDRSQEIPFIHETAPGFFEVDNITNELRFPRVSATFTGDTTRFRSFGPYHGRRYDFTVQHAPTVSGETRNLDGESVEAEPFFNYFIDFRNYTSWTRRSLFALRLFSAVSNGNNSTDIYSFGGFNTLRGYEFREFFGNRIAFMNMELRFPFVDQLRLPFGAISEIRGVIFFDIGAGWFSGGSTCDLTVDPNPGVGNEFTPPECGFYYDRGVETSSERRIFDNRTGEFRSFDFWDSKEGKLRDGRASYGFGFSFYFGPFDLNWVFAKALPFLEVNPFTGGTDLEKASGYASAFYIGRKF